MCPGDPRRCLAPAVRGNNSKTRITYGLLIISPSFPVAHSCLLRMSWLPCSLGAEEDALPSVPPRTEGPARLPPRTCFSVLSAAKNRSCWSLCLGMPEAWRFAGWPVWRCRRQASVSPSRDSAGPCLHPPARGTTHRSHVGLWERFLARILHAPACRLGTWSQMQMKAWG